MKSSSHQVTLSAVFLLLASTISSSHAQDQMQDAQADILAGQYARALTKVLPAAKAGNPVGQYLLASMYLNGHGVSPDSDEALKWLTRSADQGYARAESDLGAFYLVGRHVVSDPKRGAELLLKAAHQGEPGASYNLGVMYRDGLGVPRDAGEARKNFLDGAEKGNAAAQYALGRISYDDGHFVEATGWYERAGEQGDMDALYNLGYIYHEGQGVTRNYGKANELFLRVVEKGRFDPERRAYKALDMLGNSYRYGEGVPRDYV